jgi:hypothetical protein
VLEKDIDAGNCMSGSSCLHLSHLISFPVGLTRKEGKQDASFEYGHVGRSGNSSTRKFLPIVHASSFIK